MFNFLAEVGAGAVDMAPVAQAAVDGLIAMVKTILPIAGVGFAFMLGVKKAPQILQKFL